MEPLGANVSEIVIKFHTFSNVKMHLKMSSGKWRPFCLGLIVLKGYSTCPSITQKSARNKFWSCDLSKLTPMNEFQPDLSKNWYEQSNRVTEISLIQNPFFTAYKDMLITYFTPSLPIQHQYITRNNSGILSIWITAVIFESWYPDAIIDTQRTPNSVLLRINTQFRLKNIK